MDNSFGLKIVVLKYMPLAYVHTKNELKIQSNWAVKHRFILKIRVKTLKKCC